MCRNIFPIWALGEYRAKVLDSKAHTANGHT